MTIARWNEGNSWSWNVTMHYYVIIRVLCDREKNNQ